MAYNQEKVILHTCRYSTVMASRLSFLNTYST